MPPTTLRVGLGQLRVSADVDACVAKVGSMLQEATRLELDVVCFPEAMIGGYYGEHFKDPDAVDWAAVDKARQDLDYHPKVSIDEGVGRYVAWAKKIGVID
jgi:predicted amidohydrolase